MPTVPESAQRRSSLHEDIRRELLTQLDSRWHAVWGSFGMSIIIMGFGAQLAWHQWATQSASALMLLAAGGILWVVHRQQVRHWHATLGPRSDWLTPLDQCMVAVGLLASIFAPAERWWWPMPLLLSSSWGVFKLWFNAQAHWAHWHFMAARHTLRQRRSSTSIHQA